MLLWKHRYSVLAILFCAWLLCYVDRMVMATAIPFIAKDFRLSPLLMGEVLSAFFAGYALMQIPGGLLADRLGPRGILTASIAWWSVLTALTGMVPGFTAMLAIRALFGAGEGLFPPAAAKALSNWFPHSELGRANGVLLASTAIGSTVAPLFVVALIANWGWRSVFYSLFVPGVAVASVVWAYLRNSPAASQRIAHYETEEYDVGRVPPSAGKGSVLESLGTPAVLWCALSMFFSNTVAWGLRNWLPTYLLQARGFEPGKMGALAALINLAGALGYPLGGYLCDKYFGKRLKTPIVWGSLATALFIYLAARAPTGESASVYLFLVFLITNVVGASICTVPLVAVSKRAVGGAFGMMNTAASLAGLVSPLLIGYVLEITNNDFEQALYCLVGLSLIAILPASQIRTLTPQPPENGGQVQQETSPPG